MNDPLIILQPERKYTELLRMAFDAGPFTAARAAFAYVTRSGVDVFDKTLRQIPNASVPQDWKWLTAMDWCRSDPDALAALNAKNGHAVRVHDGLNVVTRPRCTPRRSFHPKSLILTGDDVAAVVIGSGNLSGNGLQRGHEWGTLLVWEDVDPGTVEQVASSVGHFDRLWRRATPLDAVAGAYDAIYRRPSTTGERPTPTDDDAVEETPGRGVALNDLASLRAAKKFYIEFVPNKNRGPNRPGNQLMMSRYMRVYFGFRAIDLPRDSAIGAVDLVHGAQTWHDQPLRFSNNSMDVITLPVPGTLGLPPTYDNRIVLFTRAAHRRFTFQVLDRAAGQNVIAQARAGGSARAMQSGRPWGWL